MFGLGNRAAPEPAPEPERQDGPSDAEVIARAAWLMKTAIEDPAQTKWRDFPNVPLVDLCLDLRAVLIRSDAGRAVIRPHEGGPMQVDRIDRELKARDEQIEALGRRAAAAEQDLAEVQHELAEANRQVAEMRSLIPPVGRPHRCATCAQWFSTLGEVRAHHHDTTTSGCHEGTPETGEEQG